MLQSIPDDGLDLSGMRQGRNYRIGTQVLTLRILVKMGLVVELERAHDFRFQITDSGRVLLQSETAELRQENSSAKGSVGPGVSRNTPR
jgi:DNA-binding MarR family transcriptional regulator